ncbi:MAG TPA: DUF5686 family protein [Puia sp.]|nr:DUF5686 family protein [Puia sp.]
MKILLFLGITFCSLQVPGQTRWLSGTITDATTHEPLRNASVTSKPENKGVRTDSLGRFRLPVGEGKFTLVVSMIGYAPKTVGSGSVSTIELVPDAKRLDAVVVTNKRGKYRNKDNPAVELIRKVIAEKENNRPESFDNVSYEEYDKVEISLRDIDKKKMNRKLLRPYSYLFDHPDTLTGEDTSLLYPVYLEEKISNNYLQKKPSRSKQVIIGDKKVDFGDLIDAKGMSDYVNTLLADVDIYDNNILLFTNQFLSPLSNAAPTFYEFYLGDTVTDNGERLVRLNFIPRNPDDLLFRGMFYITLDGKYAVAKVALTISKKANLNFIRNVHIRQEFIKTADGHYYRVRSDASADCSFSAKRKGIHGRKFVSYSKLVTNEAIPGSVFTEGVSDSLAAVALARPDSFWTSRRHETLSPGESRVYGNIDSLRHLRSFVRTKDLINLFVAGYKSAGSKFEIGPANTFYSFNPVEGLRLRLGGRTTPGFSKRVWLDGYGAYGFSDRRWKYDAGVAYSFNKLSDYGYPLHYIKAAFVHDVKIPGQELQFVQDNSFLLSFNRGKNDKWLYNDIFRLDYVQELPNHFSYGFGFKYWAQQPAGSIQYIQVKSSGLDTVSNISTSQLSAQVRWAPHEKFYQGRVYRIPYPNKYPIISLQYIAGIRGLFGGGYSYQNINLSVFKRCYLSAFGYTDINLTGTYISGKLPFPLLGIVPANQGYIYQANSYNLMNFLEFVSDHYAGVDVEHHFNGFILNKVPFLKRLKLREMLTAKVLYGGLRTENDPAKDPQLVKFPLLDGQMSTFGLGNQPYVEAGFAIGNIFKFLRVDAIERFSYPDHPMVPRYGVRFQLKFDY